MAWRPTHYLETSGETFSPSERDMVRYRAGTEVEIVWRGSVGGWAGPPAPAVTVRMKSGVELMVSPANVKKLEGRRARTVLRKWYEAPRGKEPDEEWYERAERALMEDRELEAHGLKDKILMAAWDAGYAYAQEKDRFYQKRFQAILLLAKRHGLDSKAHAEYKDGLKAGAESRLASWTLLPGKKARLDPAEEAYELAHKDDLLSREFDRKLGEVWKGFDRAQKELKGLQRFGSHYIEAQRVLGYAVLPPLRNLQAFVNGVVDQVGKLAK